MMIIQMTINQSISIRDVLGRDRVPVDTREKALYDLVGFPELESSGYAIECEVELLIGLSSPVVNGIFQFHCQ